MKVIHSDSISSFGGLNIVHHELDKLRVEDILNSSLPALAPQCEYKWKDLFYSFLSIYFSGGECIEDAKTVLANRFGNSPFFKLCSPDTLLRRMKELAVPNGECETTRGSVVHQYNYNEVLLDANIKLLKHIGAFNEKEIILDYDNTITFTEKADSKMTYKRDYGYQPGVCFLNEKRVLSIENRNGNSDAKSFQVATLERIFNGLERHGVARVDKFRADGASYQKDVIDLLVKKVKHFYIGGRNSYVEQYFGQISQWEETTDTLNEPTWIGEMTFTPFKKYYSAAQQVPEYRLLVKKKQRPDGQANLLTGDAFDYWCVITNDFESSVKEALAFYYGRGAAERQFDVLKNDMGWNHLPFSLLSQNTVFLYFSAMVKNLFVNLLEVFSSKYEYIKPNLRMKRLVYLLISIPGKWIRKSRQWHLRLYGHLPLRE